jgi:hypothetical protein
MKCFSKIKECIANIFNYFFFVIHIAKIIFFLLSKYY